MKSAISLPRILGFSLKGFEPIFSHDVAMSLRTGPNIILGGNGLGKTTIMQAIVYGLTGGTASEDIEEEKRLRWDHSYFRRRLRAHEARVASVEIDFAFGRRRFSVRRGFSGPDVVAFKSGGSSRWNEHRVQAREQFESTIRDLGGYENPNDFSFVVNRLLYLPETRRLIAWDTQAQTRLLMLINQDVTLEEEFRRHQEELTKVDSRKRHTHVRLGKVVSQLEQFRRAGAKAGTTRRSEMARLEIEVKKVYDELKALTRRRSKVQAERSNVTDRLSGISEEIESLRGRIEQIEAALVEGFLSEQERELGLAIHKLSESGVCPACGTAQDELKDLAQSRSRLHLCVLCGSELPHDESLELSTLRSQLVEKLRAQNAIEREFVRVSKELESLRRTEEQVERKLSRLHFELPALELVERGLPPTKEPGLARLRRVLEREEANLERQFVKLREELEHDYMEFRNATNSRMERLSRAYSKYATDFLGLPCELSETPSAGLMSISRFVPEFDGDLRETQDSCSEAQRFFLDIAFRMALVDMASELTGDKGCLVCETPENALDMSYIENVVEMFDRFSKKGHVLLLTANIQEDGIARKLLRSAPADQRMSRVLDLLKIGRLSRVHRNALPRLRAAVQKTIR